MSGGQKYELKVLAGIILSSLLAGLLAGNTLLFPLLGLLIYLAWHLYQSARLARLIAKRRYVTPPYPPGLWNEIYEALGQAQTSDRKRRRESVRYASRFLKATEAMPDGMILLDKAQRIEWANHAANTLLQIRLPRDEGRKILDLLRYPFLNEYLSAADFSQPLIFPSAARNGLIISLQVICFGKKESHRLLIIRDITQIYNLDQIRKDFVANVSHELKTPLTVVAGFIEHLNDAEKLPAQERPLELIQQQSRRMESIISDLLTLSRIEMEHGDHDPQPVHVPSMLMELIEEARNLSGNKAHEFLTDIDADLGLLGVEPELHSAFANLIFNAVKHTAPRTKISVTWKFVDQNAFLTVRDSGEGIAARHLPRLTERFYRVDQGRSRDSGGTGLGLAIVKHSVTRHGGHLDIQSRIGMGSTFRCCFRTGVFCYIQDDNSLPPPIWQDPRLPAGPN